MLRKSFFVKPKLLFKYVAYALFTVIMTSLLIYLAMQLTVYSSEALENINQAEMTKLQAAMTAEFWWIVVILIVAFAIQSIFTFHRVVGPVYAFEKIINMLKQGQVGVPVHLRRKDEFKDLANIVDGMSMTYKEVIGKDKKKLEKISAQLEDMAASLPEQQKGRIAEIRKQIAEIDSYFKIEGK
jgi:methyl-accepting chemotaxis protein